MSAPLVFQHAISIMSWEFFFILIERNQSSDMPQAISNVMRNVFGMFGCMSWAFASTSNSMVSNIIGQGKKDQVIFVIKKIVKLSTGIAIVLCMSAQSYFRNYFFPFTDKAMNLSVQGIPVIKCCIACHDPYVIFCCMAACCYRHRQYKSYFSN